MPGPKRLATAPTEIALAFGDLVVADARQLMLHAVAVILKILQLARAEPADVVIVAAAWLGAELAHDALPFPAMWSNVWAVAMIREDMGDLVRYGLVEKVRSLTFEQLEVVADHILALGPDAHLAGGLAA